MKTLKQMPYLNALTKILDVIIVVSFRKVMMEVRNGQDTVWYNVCLSESQES